MTDPRPEPVPGLFTLVLHTHLPWLAHHGCWPVGEEWLYQSWAASYLPLLRVLDTRRTDVYWRREGGFAAEHFVICTTRITREAGSSFVPPASFLQTRL